jgi:hypothetical protein
LRASTLANSSNQSHDHFNMNDRLESERRSTPRVGVSLEVDCRCGNHFLYATAVDLSLLGIFVVTPTPRPVGEEISLILRAPEVQADPFVETHGQDDAGDEHASIEVRGVVRWSTLGEEGGRSGMGISLEIDDLITRSRLLALMSRVALVDLSDAA